MDTLVSNPAWKVIVSYNRYCLEEKNRYKKYNEKLKKSRPQIEKKQMLPKLRENLQKSIN